MGIPVRTEIVHRSLQGAVGGVAATLAMSVLMGLADWAGAIGRHPPKEIAQSLLPPLPRAETNVAAVVSHFAYGAGAGAVYGLLLKPRWRNIRTGMAYGVLIWAAGYEGWLPALGIFPPAHRDRPGRSVTMFMAHVVFGAALGASSKRLGQR